MADKNWNRQLTCLHHSQAKPLPPATHPNPHLSLLTLEKHPTNQSANMQASNQSGKGIFHLRKDTLQHNLFPTILKDCFHVLL